MNELFSFRTLATSCKFIEDTRRLLVIETVPFSCGAVPQENALFCLGV